MDMFAEFTEIILSPLFKKEFANLSRQSLLDRKRLVIDYFQYLNSTNINPVVSSDVNFNYSIKIIILLLNIIHEVHEKDHEYIKVITLANNIYKEHLSDFMKFIKETKKTSTIDNKQLKFYEDRLKELSKKNQEYKIKLTNYRDLDNHNELII